MEEKEKERERRKERTGTYSLAIQQAILDNREERELDEEEIFLEVFAILRVLAVLSIPLHLNNKENIENFIIFISKELEDDILYVRYFLSKKRGESM